MIRIGKPDVQKVGERYRISASVSVNDVNPRALWLEIDSRYSAGLCADRVDGFVVGLLGFALRFKHDIIFDAPITDVLKDSIEHDFLDVICQNEPQIYRVKLFGPTISPIYPRAVVRAMGLSCGVDCMYTVHNRMLDDSLGERYFFMTDAHMQFAKETESEKNTRFQPLYQNARVFAEKMGIPLIIATTNWGPILLKGLSIDNSTTYCNCFAALMMQNLFSHYYLASGGPVKDFSTRYLKNGFLRTDCSNYDLISLSAFSTPALRFVVDGMEARVDKVRSLLEWPMCWDNLDVCEMHHGGSVGNGTFDCHKCMHTVNEIMAVGGIDGLEKFSKVFDVDYVKTHRSEFLAYLICQRIECSEVGKEVWRGRAREGCGVCDYIRALYIIIRKAIRKMLRKNVCAKRWVDI